MKKLTAVLLTVLMLCSVSAVAESFDGMVLYQNEEQGYELYIPADWTASELTGMNVIQSPDQMSNVVINVIDMGMNLTGDMLLTMLAPVTVTQLQSTFTDFALTEDPSLEEYNGKEYCIISGTCTVVGIQIRSITAFCTDDGLLYSLSFTIANIEGVDDELLAEQYEAMMSSFTITK
jgi:hypothetical protein